MKKQPQTPPSVAEFDAAPDAGAPPSLAEFDAAPGPEEFDAAPSFQQAPPPSVPAAVAGRGGAASAGLPRPSVQQDMPAGGAGITSAPALQADFEAQYPTVPKGLKAEGLKLYRDTEPEKKMREEKRLADKFGEMDLARIQKYQQEEIPKAVSEIRKSEKVLMHDIEQLPALKNQVEQLALQAQAIGTPEAIAQHEAAVNRYNSDVRFIEKQADALKGMAAAIDAEARSAALREYEIKSQTGSFFGATWNNILNNIGSTVSGFNTPLLNAMILADPPKPRDGETQEQANNRLRTSLRESMRGAPKEIAGTEGTKQEYIDKMQEGFLGGAWLGATGTLPTAAMGPAGLGMMLSASDNVAKEMEGPEFENIPEWKKQVFANTIGAIVGQLEKKGFRDAVSGGAMARSIMLRAIDRLPPNATAAQVSAMLRAETQSAIANATGKVLGGMASEASTEGMQGMAEATAKEIFNAAEDKNLIPIEGQGGKGFETPNGFSEYVSDTFKQMAQGALGGAMFASLSAVPELMRKKALGKSVGNEQFEAIEQMLRDPDLEEMLVKDIQSQVESSKISKAKADAAIAAWKEARAISEKIPPSLSTEKRKQAFDLLTEKAALSKMEKSLVADDMDEIDAALAELAGAKEVADERRDVKTAREAQAALKDTPAPTMEWSGEEVAPKPTPQEDAVPVQGTEGVPVREAPGGGQEVRGAYPEGGEAAAEGPQEAGQVAPQPDSPVRLEGAAQTIEDDRVITEGDAGTDDNAAILEGGAPSPPPPVEQAPPGVQAQAGQVGPDVYVQPRLTQDVSDDPVALASAYIEDRNAHTDGSTLEDNIITLVRNNISANSFRQFGDANKIDPDMRRAYLRENGGRDLDDLAEELTGIWGSEVTPQDIIDVVIANPSGRRVSERGRELADRYYGITGKRMNALVAKSILKGRNAKWTQEEQAIVDAAQAAQVELSEISDEDISDFNNMSDDDIDLFWGPPKIAAAEQKTQRDDKAKQVQQGRTQQDAGAVRGAEGTGAAQAARKDFDDEAKRLKDAFDAALKERDKAAKDFRKRGERLFDDGDIATRKKRAEPGMFAEQGDDRANSAEDMEAFLEPYEQRMEAARKELEDHYENEEKFIADRVKAAEAQGRIDDMRDIDEALGLGDAPMAQSPKDEQEEGAKIERKDIENLVKALRGLMPDLKVVQPKTKEDYANAVKQAGEGFETSWGLTDFAGQTIYINPASKAQRQTLFHEGAHPVLLAVARMRPDIINAFAQQLADMPEGSKYREYGLRYLEEPTLRRQQEMLSEFLGDAMDGKIPVSTRPDSLWQRFKAFIKDILAALGWDMRTIDLSKPSDVRAFAAEFKKAMEKGIRITGLPQVGGQGGAMMQKSPKDIAQMFKAKGMNAQQAREYMEARGVAPQVVEAIVSNMRRQKTSEQKAAERMAEQKPATRTGPPLPMSEQVGAEARGRKVVGEGKVVVDEKQALKNQIRLEIRAAIDGGKEVARKVSAVLEKYRTKLSPAQATALTRAAARAVTPATQRRFAAYADRIIADSELAAKEKEARDTIKKIKKLLKGKADERRDAMLNDLAGRFAKLPVPEASIDEHIDMAKRLLDTLSMPKAKATPEVVTAKDTEINITNKELESYIAQQEAVQKAAAEQDSMDDIIAMREAMGVDAAEMTDEEIKVIMDAMSGAQDKADAAQRLTEMQEKVRMLRSVARMKMEELAQYEKRRLADEDAPLSDDQRAMLADLKDIDIDRLTDEEAAFLIMAANNIIVNDRWGGVRDFAARGRSDRGIAMTEKALEPIRRIGKPGDENRLFNATDTVEIMAEKIMRGPTAAAKFMQASGLHDLLASISAAKRELDSVVRRRNDAAKRLGFRQHKDDSVLNRYKMGFYAYLIQHKGGSKEDIQRQFDRRAENVRESVRRMQSASILPQHKRNADLYVQAANDVLGDATGIDGLSIDPKLKGMVLHQIEEMKRQREATFAAAEYDHNKTPEAYENYTAQRSMAVTDESKADEQKDLFERPAWGNRLVDSSPSSSKMDRSDTLLPGHAINADFFSVQDQSIFETIADNLGARHLATLRDFLSDPRTLEMLGSGTRRMLKQRVRDIIGADGAREAIMSQSLNRLYYGIAKRSMGIALKGVMQAPKQATVAISTYIGLGKDANLMWQSYADAVKAFMDKEDSWQYNLVKDEQIHERAKTLGGLEKLGDAIAKKAIIRGDEGVASALAKIAAHEFGVATDKLFVPLAASDAISAQAAWFAFYKKKLRDKGVDLRSDGWKQKKDPEAAAYANQMVSRQQNANASESMAQIYRDKGAGRILVDLMFSYSSFALNMKKRMARDVQTLLSGAKEDKAYAARDLAGLTIETAAFTMMTYWLAVFAKGLADKLADEVFGPDDDDEQDTSEWMTEVGARTAFEVLFGGIPEIAGNAVKAGANEGAKAIAEHMGKSVRNDGKDLFYVPHGSYMGSGRYGAIADELAYLYNASTNLNEKEAKALGMLSLLSTIGISDQTFTRPMERELNKRLMKKKKNKTRSRSRAALEAARRAAR